MSGVDLKLGPALRHVDDTTATVWVETSAPATFEVRAGAATAEIPTFTIEGHHYGLLVLNGLEPGTETPYDVRLDGVRVWPRAGDERPPPTIRTLVPQDEAPEHDFDIAFGSCRVDRPHEPPYTLSEDEHREGVGHDALAALSRDCQAGRRRVPDLLLMLGDQVYADEGVTPPIRRRQIERRGADSEPTDEVRDFEEYTWLYADSWGDPDVRWLLATVPTAMIFDDHDVHDDWNTSDAWRAKMHRQPWWEERITGAYMSYWVYQHVGNLSPAAMEREQLLARVRDASARTGDAGPLLREFAARADEEVDGHKQSCWSYMRHLGRTRLVVIDTRSGRVLGGDRRDMLSDGEWRQVEAWLHGDVDHWLVASTLPLLLERAAHDVEAWNEAVCKSAWGRLLARAGELLRQTADLEHWASFERSFAHLVGLLGDLAAGRRGSTPATVLMLSGDVHHSYVAPFRYPDSAGVVAPVRQVVSSPLRNAFPRAQRRAFQFANTETARRVGRVLRRSVGLPDPPVDWRLSAGPFFGNTVGSLRISGTQVLVRLERAHGGPDGPTLRVVHQEHVGR